MNNPRLIAIGDIHGQISQLRSLLECITKLDLTDGDTLIFLGDYIDRGDNSRAVIELLIEIQAARPNTVFLRGNHEQLLINAWDGPQPKVTEWNTIISGPELKLWLDNGGTHTIDDYELENVLGIWSDFPSTHEEFIRGTTMEYRQRGYLFVHAGLLNFGEWWEGAGYDLDPRIWIREPFLSSEEDYGFVVVFGHTPQITGIPLIMDNKMGIDTAAVFGQCLTAVVLEEDVPPHFIQVFSGGVVQEHELTKKGLKVRN